MRNIYSGVLDELVQVSCRLLANGCEDLYSAEDAVATLRLVLELIRRFHEARNLHHHVIGPMPKHWDSYSLSSAQHPVLVMRQRLVDSAALHLVDFLLKV